MEESIAEKYKRLEKKSLEGRKKNKTPKILPKKEIVKGKLGCDARKRLGGSGG